MKIILLFLLTCLTASAQIVLSGNSLVSGNAAFLNTAAAGGTPTGNVWTINTTNQTTGGTSITVPAGSVGDVIIVLTKFEQTGGVTLNTLTNSSTGGLMTLVGSQINNVTDTALSAHAGYLIATNAGSMNIVGAWSSTPSFIDWAAYRCSVSGTPSFASAQAQGTGTSVTAGTYTTATQNGLLVAICGPNGSATHASTQFGGQAATLLDITGTSADAFSYLHTATQTSANFTDTLGTSRSWVVKIVSATAQ